MTDFTDLERLAQRQIASLDHRFHRLKEGTRAWMTRAFVIDRLDEAGLDGKALAALPGAALDLVFRRAGWRPDAPISSGMAGLWRACVGGAVDAGEDLPPPGARSLSAAEAAARLKARATS